MGTIPNYDVNLEDERFQTVEAERQDALTGVQNTYNNMIDQSDNFYNAQVDASKEWAQQQQDILDQQTDFTIEQINQQKEQAEKDYKKEQSGAYTDWQKQSNNYGVNAEQMAASGLSTTGYAESSRVAMYNTYQNRAATAREGHIKITQNFDNAINEARLENNAAKAEIAMQTYLKQTEILLQGFQYKNELMAQLQSQMQSTNQYYDSKWQNVYDQIMQENAFSESIRQYEEQKNYQAEQDRIAQENWQKEYDEMVRQYNQKLLEEQRQYDQKLLEEQRQYDQNLLEEQRQFNETLAANSGTLEKEEDVAKQSTVYADNQPTTSDTYVKPLGEYSLSNFNELSKLRNTSQSINGQKATLSGLNASILPSGEGFSTDKPIWNANGKYYAWSEVAEDYIDVTELVTFSGNKAQPKYINNVELKSVGTIGGTIGSHGDLPQKQNVWRAGNKYYVWDEKTREYEDVTSKYNSYLQKVQKRNKQIENFVHATYT